MHYKNFLAKHFKLLVYLSMILIALGLISDFIITIVWWLRIHPWMAHAKQSGKLVYISTFMCWIISLIGFISILILFSKSKYLQLQSKEIAFPPWMTYFTIIICLSSLLSSVSGVTASSFALKNEKVSLGKFGKLKNKCYRYILQSNPMKEWAIKKGKEEEFETWYNDLLDKISSCKSSDCDHKNPYKQYLFYEVGVPTLIFSIIEIIGIILLILLIISQNKLFDDSTILYNEIK